MTLILTSEQERQLRMLQDSDGRPVFTPELLERIVRIMVTEEDLDATDE